MPFGLTQALGIYAAWRFLPGAIITEPIGWSGFSWIDFLVLVLFVVIFFVFVAKFKRAGAVFFRVLLSLLIFSGSQAISGIWFGPSISGVLALAITVLFWFLQNIIMQNIAMVLTLAGIGAVLGLSLLPMTVIYILVIFSFYDIAAVYKTGHMVKLAEAMIRSRAIFGFVIPEPGQTARRKISSVAPGQGFMILGSGDVIFPLLLSASLIRISIFQSIIVAVFAAGGLFLMHLIFSNQQTRRPMAALPPIALMAIIGYLVANLM